MTFRFVAVPKPNTLPRAHNNTSDIAKIYNFNNFIIYATPLYPQKLALTSPTNGGRSVGIVRLRTKATELVSNIKSVL
jgi:hypothetical protein